MIRLIAFDLDDTLLDSTGEIPESAARLVTGLQKGGVLISIITGRNYPASKRFVEALGIKSPCGFLNGAVILDPLTSEVISSQPIDPESAEGIVAVAEDAGIHVNYYWDGMIYCKEKTQYAQAYENMTGIQIAIVDSLKGRAALAPPEKMILMADHETLELLQKQLTSTYGDRVSLSFSKPEYLEVYDQRVSKGTALQRIAANHGVEQADTAAFGDGGNDIPMLQWAGIGIAMGNATQEVQAAAGFTTLTADADGIVHGIRKYLMG